MKISIPKKSENLQTLMRQVGYSPSRNRYKEQGFVRSARSGAFPRFHIYSQENKDTWILDLHLDQRKTSHAGTRAHGGEHTGAAINKEAERIKNNLL